MTNATNFKEFLNTGKTITETEDLTSTELANSLRLTLGTRLARKGWNLGSKNSGVVAMIDKSDEAKEEATAIIETFLKSVKLPGKLTAGKLGDSVSVAYRGSLLSIVETNEVLKVTVS